MKIETTADLLSALKGLRDLENLRQELQRLRGLEASLKIIENKVLDTEKLIKAAVDCIEPNRTTLDSIKNELDYVKTHWDKQTKGKLTNWNVHSDTLDFRTVEKVISDTAQLKLKDLMAKVAAMVRICSLLEILRILTRKFESIRMKLVSLSEKSLTEETFKKLKELYGEITSLADKAKKLGADPDLMIFLEKASSAEGASFEDVSQKILELLEQHGLDNFLRAKLVEVKE